jgi:hypothetical protein
MVLTGGIFSFGAEQAITKNMIATYGKLFFIGGLIYKRKGSFYVRKGFNYE